jgi:hypothetical protein
LIIVIWDLPFDAAQGGELVEPFEIWSLSFEICLGFEFWDLGFKQWSHASENAPLAMIFCLGNKGK